MEGKFESSNLPRHHGNVKTNLSWFCEIVVLSYFVTSLGMHGEPPKMLPAKSLLDSTDHIAPTNAKKKGSQPPVSCKLLPWVFSGTMGSFISLDRQCLKQPHSQSRTVKVGRGGKE